MLIHQRFLVFICVGALSACASSTPKTPKFNSKDYVSAFQVMKSARCEINAAATDIDDPWLKFSAVNMDFVLQVVETHGLTGDPSLVVPVDEATATLGGSFGRTNKATRIINLKFVHQMRNQLDCSDAQLAGGLGIAGWVDLVKRATTGTFKPTSLSQKITFEITRSADGDLKITRAIGSGTRDLSLGFPNSRNLKHEVILAIVPDAAAPKKTPKPKAATPAAEMESFRQQNLDAFIQRFDDDNDE